MIAFNLDKIVTGYLVTKVWFIVRLIDFGCGYE